MILNRVSAIDDAKIIKYNLINIRFNINFYSKIN